MNATKMQFSFTRGSLFRFCQTKKHISTSIGFYLPVALGLITMGNALAAADASADELATSGGAPAPLVSGWSVLKEGEAEGTAEIDAKHPTNPDPHLLKIAITKLAPFGDGRLGLKNSTPIAVTKGRSYDITFNGLSEGIGVGLVFSLETDDGKVLARTTLPEIGRGAGGGRRGGRGGRGATPNPGSANSAAATSPVIAPAQPSVQPPPWRKYLLSLKATASSPNAHLTVTAIEPVPVWIENLTIVERQPSK